MQAIPVGQAFDRGDVFALGLNPEHQTGVGGAAIQNNAACAAVARQAAFFRAGIAHDITQHFEQALARFTQELGFFSIDGCFVRVLSSCLSCLPDQD